MSNPNKPSKALRIQRAARAALRAAGIDQVYQEAMRTSALVHNLLDMARLQSGQVTLKKEWQPLEEVVGAALQARASVLAQHRVRVDLPADLPLLGFLYHTGFKPSQRLAFMREA